MKLLITGVNHRTAPVEVRERLAFSDEMLPSALGQLKRAAGFLEGFILSTCNRVEIVVAAEERSDPKRLVRQFLEEVQAVEPNWVLPYLYDFEGRDAIRHLFRVAASLDSMVVGEPQILGQLKSAYMLAKSQGALSGFLDLVLTRAFSVAKRVRSETEIGRSAVSISYAAVEMAREIFGSFTSKKVMVIGAGKMSELAARHLRRCGCSHIYVTNRTWERAVELAQIFEGTTVEYEKFLTMLPEVDIVITSSGAPHYILAKDEMRRVIEARRNRPMFLIDIAVPRNIDPSVNEIDNVFLYDIDDLQKVIDGNLRGRMQEAGQAEQIIAEEVERLVCRLKTREVVPTIVSLQEQLELIRQAELERLRGKLGPLTPQQEEALTALTKGIINKIAHAPIAELRKNAGTPDGLQVAELIRKLFRLAE